MAVSHAARLDASRRRLVELRERMDRLRVGEPPSGADVERARRAADIQQKAARAAQERLVSTRVRAASHSRAMADLRARGPGLPTASLVGLAEENRRLREALVAIAPAKDAAHSQDRLRQVWRELLEECRSAEWRGWANALCVVASRFIPTVRGAALTVRDQHHEPHALAASDRWAWDVELIHQVVGEGPALEVSRVRPRVVVDDLDDEASRWPGFVDMAAEFGVRSVFASVLRLGDLTGSLTLYRTRTGPLGAPLASDVALLAAVSASALAADAEARNRDPSTGLEGDAGEISIATGMLSVQFGVTVTDARSLLMAHAFGEALSLIDAAAEVIRGTSKLTRP